MQFISLICYVMAVLIRPQEWISILSGVPIVDFFAGITIVFTLMAVSKGRMKVPRVPENLFMIGFFCAALISHVVHMYLGGFIWTFQDVGKILILYFLMVIIVDSEKKIRILAWLFVLSAVFMAIGGIFQFYRGYGFAGIMPVIKHGVIRVIGYGIFSDPNDLALFFAAVIPFVLAFIMERRGFFSMLFAGICGSLIVVSTWFTNSRSGILAFIIAILMFFRRRVKGVNWILAGFLFLMVVGSFLPSRLTGSFFDKSAYERVIYWGYGNRMLKENPVFGVGYSMFPYYSDWAAAHNSFVNCYAELGSFGYFWWIGVLYVVMFGAWSLKLQERYENTKYGKGLMFMNDAVLASITGYLTAGFMLSRTYILPLYILIALGVKVRYLATDSSYMARDLLPGYHIKRIFLISTGSILFIYMATRFLLTRF